LTTNWQSVDTWNHKAGYAFNSYWQLSTYTWWQSTHSVPIFDRCFINPWSVNTRSCIVCLCCA